jgi:hypothetical protein
MSAGRPEAGVPEQPSPDASMVGIGVVLLFAILVFILQNGQRVRVRFLMANGTLPLGAALLFAALLVLVAGAAAAGGVAAPSPHRPAALSGQMLRPLPPGDPEHKTECPVLLS